MQLSVEKVYDILQLYNMYVGPISTALLSIFFGYYIKTTREDIKEAKASGEKFNQIHSRINKVETRIDNVDSKLSSLRDTIINILMGKHDKNE
jgi:hypothetical protein